METRVVCVKVADIRPEYDNLKEWMADPQNVYIGRRGIVFVDGKRFPPKDSIWANPFKIGKHGTREEVLAKYREYIEPKLDNLDWQRELKHLKGKTLGCWCVKPDQLVCHGQVLVELLEQLE